MSFEAVICPSCSKNIQIPTDVPAPRCPYCGYSFASETAAPAATLSALLGLARTALAAGNSQEALEYFNRVLESDPTNSEAWLGKGKAAGWLSSTVAMRVPEMLLAFNHAIANTPDEQKEATIVDAVNEANRLIVALYNMSRNHMLEYVSLDNIWSGYIGQVGNLLSYLDEVSAWRPTDLTTIENIVHLCKDNIEGVSYRDKFDQNTPKAWTLSPHYESLLKSKMDLATARLQALDPNYTPPSIEKKKADNCFVVTATMGDFEHPKVVLLRRFRDQWLLRRRWGQPTVDWYYRNGPAAAKIIANSKVLRMASYLLIVMPSAILAYIVLPDNKRKV